jgi:hypothetical protein
MVLIVDGISAIFQQTGVKNNTGSRATPDGQCSC